MLDDYQTIALRFPVVVRAFKDDWGVGSTGQPPLGAAALLSQ